MLIQRWSLCTPSGAENVFVLSLRARARVRTVLQQTDPLLREPKASERGRMPPIKNADLAGFAQRAAKGDEAAFATLLSSLQPMIHKLAQQAGPRLEYDDATAIAMLVIWQSCLRHDKVKRWRTYLRARIQGELQDQRRTTTYAVRPPRKDRRPECPRSQFAWAPDVRLNHLVQSDALDDAALVVAANAEDLDVAKTRKVMRRAIGRYAARLSALDRKLFLGQTLEPRVSLRQLSRELGAASSKLCERMKELRAAFEESLRRNRSWPMLVEAHGTR
jgi:RNA polymerase sigma factor (sigma-70 family)